MIRQSSGFALARFADGEASVLKNLTVGNKDGWLYETDENLIFRADLRKALLCRDPGYYYGISCTCCDKENHDYLLGMLRTDLDQVTYSNLWVNANYSTFKELFAETVRASRKEVVLITGKKADVRALAGTFEVKAFLPIPGNCVTYWETHREDLRARLDLHASTRNDAVFLVAAGPLSEILIHELWQVNPRNTYLDIGSTLDPILFRRKSRDYHTDGDRYSQRVCVF